MYHLNDVFRDDGEYSARAEFCNKNGYCIEEIEPDEGGRRFKISNLILSEEQKKRNVIDSLKTELEKIKEDIEQETFGIVRSDFAEKKARAAQIVNELRVLEGKEPREVRA